MLLSISEFIGHLHPVLVHLPIGILLLGCLFIWQIRRDKHAHLRTTINVILLLGIISALLSCATGWILSGNGDYDDTLVSVHQWMGISVAVLSILLYYSGKIKRGARWQGPLALLLLVLIFITGHLGGSLTHGSDYLTAPLQNLSSPSTDAMPHHPPIPNIQDAVLFTDVIQPILSEKCVGCHGPKRQKGGLRMDQPALLLRGGKDGLVLHPGKPVESELIKRILLPPEAEHHMPPREKPSLNEREIDILKWWVMQGADLSKKVKEIPQPEKIKSELLAMQTDTVQKKPWDMVPAAPTTPGNEKIIESLGNVGLLIRPISVSSNYLQANLRIPNGLHDTNIGALAQLKKQLVWLKLSGASITDSALDAIGQCGQLTSLQLDHTGVTDLGIGFLRSLDSLRTLNLVGTRVTVTGIMKLSALKKLRTLYLFQTGIQQKDWQTLHRAFPHSSLDSGGYSLVFLQTDTMLVKPPKPK